MVVATSAPELLAGEEEQAAADASLSRAPPPAMATAGFGGLLSGLGHDKKHSNTLNHQQS